jgi:hypothetical protein
MLAYLIFRDFIFEECHIKYCSCDNLLEKIIVLWNVMPCSSADKYQCFGGTRCIHLCSSTLIVETTGSSQMLVLVDRANSIIFQKTTFLMFITLRISVSTFVRFEVPTMVTTKITIFKNITSCSWIGEHTESIFSLKMEAVCYSKTPVTVYWTTQCQSQQTAVFLPQIVFVFHWISALKCKIFAVMRM